MSSSSSLSSNKRQKKDGPLSPKSTSNLHKQATEKMNAFRSEAEDRAVGLLETFLPQKIVELGRVLEAPEFNVKGTSAFDPGELPILTKKVSKKPKKSTTATKDRLSSDPDANDSDDDDSDDDSTSGSNRIVPSNKTIQQCMMYLKKEAHEGVQALSAIKLWIQLLVPRIEDGNNFGVEVQEECSGEIERVETQMFSLMQTSAKYFTERAKLAEHWSKHPHIMDFRQAVQERDQLEYFTLCVFLRDMRANFATLHDLICKNLEKILKPKGDDDDASGRSMMMM